MTIPTDVIIRMATLSLSVDQAKAVAEMLSAVESATKAEAETVIEHGRELGRQRWRKWDEKRRSNVSKREQTADDVSKHSRAGDARGLDKTSIQRIEPQEEVKKEKERSPREMLETVLSPDRANDVIEMRQRIKAPLTARAAELLARELGKWPVPDEAADEMVQRAWRGFKPEWMAGAQVRAGPQRRTNPLVDALGALIENGNSDDRHPPQTSAPVLDLSAASGRRALTDGSDWSGVAQVRSA